jgi:membrane protein
MPRPQDQRQREAQWSRETRDGRPVPDEAPLEAPSSSTAARPRDLSGRDWIAIVKTAGKRTIDDNMPMIAQALAYSAFMAIPAVLLVTLGVFTLVAGPQTITTLMHHFGSVMPQQATQLLGKSLNRLSSHPSAGITITILGFVLAIWSTTGAMTSYMTALNLAYDRKDQRNFVKKRLVALLMVGCIGFAFLLVAGLLVFGPTIERYLGRAVNEETLVGWLWWTLQWPILILGLLAAFATLLWLGPDAEVRSWRFLTPGSIVAVVMWLVVSGAFGFYTSKFGSYNKTWGSLAAVIVMLTWLWLTSLALLFGAELNAEVERSRELRQGKPAEQELQAPARSE